MDRATFVWVIPAMLVLCPSALFAADFKPGDSEGMLQHGGRERTYLLHVPPQYDGKKALPLVLFFHGGGGNAKHGAANYGWKEKADEKGFIVAYPNGTGPIPTWNVPHGCGSAHRNNIDDVGFVRALLKELQSKLQIDSNRIFVTGMSNGGMLSHRLAAELSDQIAAAAPVAGCIGGKENANETEKRIQQPANPVAMLIVHGKEDKNVPYDGGRAQGVEPNRIDISTADGVQFWVKANKCEPTAKKETSHGGNVLKEEYTSPSGADVVFYTIVDGGHSWPGSKMRRFRQKSESTNSISATDVAWDFFEKHPKK